MTTLVSTNNTVGFNKRSGKSQVYLANQSFLSKAKLDIGVKFDICLVNETKVEFIPHSVDNVNVISTLTVSKKGVKRIVDVVGNLPETFMVGARLRVIAVSGKLVITLHHEVAMVESREQDILSRLDDGKEVKVATMFMGNKMRNMLKRNGLVRLSNDVSCRLAIELEPSSFYLAQQQNPQYWQKPNVASLGAIQDVDFSKVDLPSVNGLLIDASHFDIKVDKKAGKSRQLSSDDDCDPQGVQLLSVVEVLKRTNPAFVNIQLSPKAFGDKKVQVEYEKGINILMTILSSVLNSLGYNLEQNVLLNEGSEIISLMAISKNLTLDSITNSTVVSSVTGDLKAVVPRLIEPSGFVAERVRFRESKVSSLVRSGLPLTMGSAYSGGGILDRSLHEGFADFGIETYCKFGMEWEEEYFNSNFKNNAAVWRKDSYFLLGDVRGVNVYINPLNWVAALSMGIPCIGASRSGLVKNNISCAEEHEVAGALFISSLEIIKSSNPVVLTIENVPEYQSSVSMVVIRSVLHYLGYDISEDVFGGNAYGALENRQRLALVATSKGFKGTDVISNVRSLRHKEEKLQDVTDTLTLDDPTWTWRDYLDAKAVNDKAKGNNFDQQILTGLESKCGTIGKSYQKARSTEPFLRHPLWELYKDCSNMLIGGDDPVQIAEDIITTDAELRLYANTANDAVRRYNLRNKLQGDDRKISALAAVIDDCNVRSMQPVLDAIAGDELIKQEFIEATTAISKTTRLYNPNEHAAFKTVPKFLVDGLSATRAHEILGNGVVFSLFQAIGRSIACHILTSVIGNDCVSLVDYDIDCLNEGSDDIQHFWYNKSSDVFNRKMHCETDEHIRIRLIRNTRSVYSVCLNDMPKSIVDRLVPNVQKVFDDKRLLAA